MNLESVEKTYRRYAPRYDLLFGAVFHPGRKAVIQRMSCQADEQVLEVGVGTGLSLPLYPATTQITGIDLSKEMLARAEKRVARDRLDNVRLQQMNAQEMTFPDNSFDKVVAMYVASVVPDPVKLVNEMRRVCKPGGQLIFVNHFQSDHPVIKWVENLLVPLSAKIGFNPGFSLSAFKRECDLEIEHNHRVNLFGYWRLLQTTNDLQPKDEEPAVDATTTQSPELESFDVAVAKMR